jgi:hypothetical protein
METKPIKDSLVELLAGAAGGMAGLAVGYPADTVKVHQQVSGDSVRNVIKNIWRTRGARGYFRGMTVPLVTNGAIFAVFFPSYVAALEYFASQDGRLAHIREHKKSIEDVASYKEVFAAGCFGGFCQALVASPIEFLKVQLQISKQKEAPRAKDIIQKIITHRGYWGLGIGMRATMWRDLHSHGVYTICYKYYLDTFCSTPGFACIFMAGGIAGCLYWWSCIPMDVVKSTIQADSVSNPVYKGSWDCVRKLYKKGGFRPFLRGYSTVAIRAFPANGAVFLVHDSLRTLLERCGFCGPY